MTQDNLVISILKAHSWTWQIDGKRKLFGFHKPKKADMRMFFFFRYAISWTVFKGKT